MFDKNAHNKMTECSVNAFGLSVLVISYIFHVPVTKSFHCDWTCRSCEDSCRTIACVASAKVAIWTADFVT